MSDWKDAATHRKPDWPLCGYAPGKYMGKCTDCGGQFVGMDKRAWQCLPCAVDFEHSKHTTMMQKIRDLKAENETLRSTIEIVYPAALSKAGTE